MHCDFSSTLHCKRSLYEGISIYNRSEQVLVAWLVGDHLLLLRNFGSYVIIFMNDFIVTTVAIVIMLIEVCCVCVLIFLLYRFS
jgi:hypothetical protein